MSQLQTEIRRLISGYVRQGGKDNRRQQARRMMAFGDYCAQQGAQGLAQVGSKHVIRYWQTESLQQLSDATRLSHFYALAALWRLAGKPGSPPRPYPVDHRPMGCRDW